MMLAGCILSVISSCCVGLHPLAPYGHSAISFSSTAKGKLGAQKRKLLDTFQGEMDTIHTVLTKMHPVKKKKYSTSLQRTLNN